MQSDILVDPVKKLDFNCSSSFALSWLDKVTTGTYSCVSVSVNVGSWPTIGLSITKHLLDQVRKRLISNKFAIFKSIKNY